MTHDPFETWSALAHRDAEATTDAHTTECPGCATGVCAIADDLFTDEFRTYEQWRDVDRSAADAYRRATTPQEGAP